MTSVGYSWIMDRREHIELNPQVLAGKPVVKNTRISVELVLDMMAASVPESEIQRNYPNLDAPAIRACVAYAAQSLKSENVYPLSA